MALNRLNDKLVTPSAASAWGGGASEVGNYNISPEAMAASNRGAAGTGAAPSSPVDRTVPGSTSGDHRVASVSAAAQSAPPGSPEQGAAINNAITSSNTKPTATYVPYNVHTNTPGNADTAPVSAFPAGVGQGTGAPRDQYGNAILNPTTPTESSNSGTGTTSNTSPGSGTGATTPTSPTSPTLPGSGTGTTPQTAPPLQYNQPAAQTSDVDAKLMALIDKLLGSSGNQDLVNSQLSQATRDIQMQTEGRRRELADRLGAGGVRGGVASAAMRDVENTGSAALGTAQADIRQAAMQQAQQDQIAGLGALGQMRATNVESDTTKLGQQIQRELGLSQIQATLSAAALQASTQTAIAQMNNATQTSLGMANIAMQKEIAANDLNVKLKQLGLEQQQIDQLVSYQNRQLDIAAQQAEADKTYKSGLLAQGDKQLNIAQQGQDWQKEYQGGQLAQGQQTVDTNKAAQAWQQVYQQSMVDQGNSELAIQKANSDWNKIYQQGQLDINKTTADNNALYQTGMLDNAKTQTTNDFTLGTQSNAINAGANENSYNATTRQQNINLALELLNSGITLDSATWDKIIGLLDGTIGG